MHFQAPTLHWIHFSLRLKVPNSYTLQPEIIAKFIPKTLFHVTEMRFSETITPKTKFPCNSLNRKRRRDMYFLGNEFPPPQKKNIPVTAMSFIGKLIPKNRNVCM